MLDCLLIPTYLLVSIFVSLSRPILAAIFGVRVARCAVPVFFKKYRYWCLSISLLLYVIIILLLNVT